MTFKSIFNYMTLTLYSRIVVIIKQRKKNRGIRKQSVKNNTYELKKKKTMFIFNLNICNLKTTKTKNYKK